MIDCFHNGLAAQQLYRDFGRNRPRSVVALRDMILAWADQEEQERDRFPRREDNNQKRNGDPRSDKSQRNFDKKRKPEDTVATMERGKKERREINRTISKNYSKDLALCTLKEST